MSAEQDLANANVQIAQFVSEARRFIDASMGLNNIYPTITEGRQAVADGKYFSVPGNGAYMRLYRRQGSSAELTAEFPDRAELNSVIAQLGPLLGRGVVGSSGDLMARGAYGLGADPNYNAPNISDVTQDYESGFYRIRMDSVGAPEGDVNFWGSLLFTNGQGGRRHALLHEYLGSPGSKLHVGVRGSNTGEMIWQYALLNTDVLGKVSQSEGRSTGAIIERGSNANGKYVKLADGTMFCWMEIAFTYANESWQNFIFPQAFHSRPWLSHSLVGTDPSQFMRHKAVTVCNHGGSSDSTIGRAIFRTTGTTLTTTDLSDTLLVTAQGRWRE